MSDGAPGNQEIWAVRQFIFEFLLDRERVPSADEAAAGLGISPEEARDAFQDLNARHLLFLGPDGSIRMIHPFSGVPTSFRVHANGRSYWANCAWDAFGIPAALHADAEIDALCSDTGETARLGVKDGHVLGHGEVVHFFLPFRRWYDDIVFT